MGGTVIAYGLTFGLLILSGPAPAPAPVPVVDEPVEPVETLELLEPVEPLEPLEPVEPVEPVESLEAVESLEPVEAAESLETVEPVEPVDQVEYLEAMELVEPVKLRSCLKKPKEPAPVAVPVSFVKEFRIKATPTRVEIVSRWIVKEEHCHNRSSEKRRWIFDEDDEDIIMHNDGINGE